MLVLARMSVAEIRENLPQALLLPKDGTSNGGSICIKLLRLLRNSDFCRFVEG